MLMLMLMLALAKLTKLLTVLYCPAIVHLNMPVHQGGSVVAASILKKCVICGNPVSDKKLVRLNGNRPAHRGCGPLLAGKTASASAQRGLAVPKKTQRPMSRAELLKRIEELRKRDAKKKVVVKKRQPRSRPEPKMTSVRAATPPAPQPFSGVEMKYRNGRWIQMHPDSE
ncbi:hypothetical protein OG596_17505 [Streptomyces sp. NBC_01102]|uniref:hypothetical protein n=2 Tax=Streptomyces TaxID=1883 RepID=UPI0038682130|nr:hypothetical protein OG596_17505 [Streptomyces sp. NBC_01102]